VYTVKQLMAANKAVLAKCRTDIVESWQAEADPEKREQLWHEQRAIERIEEQLGNEREFTSALQRAAGDD
jgi:hypothetical protein